jgi:hypothetical protein
MNEERMKILQMLQEGNSDGKVRAGRSIAPNGQYSRV